MVREDEIGRIHMLGAWYIMGHTVLCQPVPWYMKNGIKVLEAWYTVRCTKMYQAVPSHPMVHEDRMDSRISILGA